MRIVCGLGNPGRTCRFTRHNAGSLVVDELCNYFNRKLKEGRRNYLYTETEGLLLTKPTLFMNESGRAVLDLVTEYDISPSELLIICDDINLPFGRLRLRKKGGDGGHKGLGSIIYYLETEDFARLRIGIGKPPGNYTSYVLSEFTQEEKERLHSIIGEARDGVLVLFREGIDKAQSVINVKNGSGDADEPR